MHSNNGKKILILGGGTMQLPSIRSALSRGWRVTVADGNPNAPGGEWAHRFINVDLRDVEGMIEAAEDLSYREGLDGVFTAGTDFSFTVAHVARALGLPGIAPEAAKAASDKVEMRRAFEKAGIPSPRFIRISTDEPADEKVSDLSFPLVVKPVDNMGARGVRKVDTPVELREAVEEARESSFNGNVIVEEYIEGFEFSVDALVENGRVTITGFADRIICFPPYFVEMGHTLPSRIEPKLRRRIERTFAEAIEALGIRDGAAKGDLKWNGREPVVGEVAARLSGGYMSGWTFPYATGVDLVGAAMKISLGLPKGNVDSEDSWVSAERAFISIPGVVKKLYGVEDVRKIEGVREVFVRVSPGDEVRFPINNVQKCGNIIASMERRERACEAAESAVRGIFVRLEPRVPRTARFLFGKSEERIREAFELHSPQNSRIVEKMSDYYYIGAEAGAPEGDGSGRVPDILVARPPKLEIEDGRDWHGASLFETFEWVLRFLNIGVVESRETVEEISTESGEENDIRMMKREKGGSRDSLVLGRLFWIAFLHGGAQGAVWLVDTVREILVEGSELEGWIATLPSGGERSTSEHEKNRRAK